MVIKNSRRKLVNRWGKEDTKTAFEVILESGKTVMKNFDGRDPRVLRRSRRRAAAMRRLRRRRR